MLILLRLFQDILVLNTGPGQLHAFPRPDLVPLRRLAANARLQVDYGVQPGSSADAGRVTVLLRFLNTGEETVRKVEVTVSETAAIGLEQGEAEPLNLPFELPARASNEHRLHLRFRALNCTQRLRASVAYLAEESQGKTLAEKLDCRLVFPAIGFLSFATSGV